MKIKEEDPLSDAAPQNALEFFFEDLPEEINSDTICNNDHEMKIKQEAPFSDFCSQKEGCSIDYEIYTKRQIQEEIILPDICSVTNRESFTEGAVMKVNKQNTDSEVVTKVEIKEEPCWLETAEASTVEINDATNEDLPPTELTRLCIAAACDDSDKSALVSNEEILGKEMTDNLGKDNTKYEKTNQHTILESWPTELSSVEKNLSSEQSAKNNVSAKTDSTTSGLKQIVVQQSDIHGNISYEKSSACKSGLVGQDLNHAHGKAYKCDICEKVFSRIFNLKVHQFIHNKCDICGKGFTQSHHLKVHKLIHEIKKPCKCRYCEAEFTDFLDLKKHHLIHKNIFRYKCNICEKDFARLSLLNCHNLIHEGKQPHKCDVCGDTFYQLQLLKLHSLIHQGKAPYKCDICNNTFIRLSDLRVHNSIHKGRKSYKCDICEKIFIKYSSLKSHNLIHKGIKPHKCEICGMCFTVMQSLKRHIVTHKGIRSYKCKICDKGFTQLAHLRGHSSIHENQKPHKCAICEKSFVRMYSLKKHILVHARINLYKCYICEKAYSQLADLKLHILSHEGEKA